MMKMNFNDSTSIVSCQKDDLTCVVLLSRFGGLRCIFFQYFTLFVACTFITEQLIFCRCLLLSLS